MKFPELEGLPPARQFAHVVGQAVPTVAEVRVVESPAQVSACVVMDGEEPTADVDRVFRLELDFLHQHPDVEIDTRVLSRRHHSPLDIERIIPPRAWLAWAKPGP